MKQSTKIAKNYARALFELGELSGNDLSLQETILSELNNINEIINKVKDAKVIFTTPVIAKDEKKELIQKLLQGKIDQKVLNFLFLLIDKQRFNMLPEIQDELNKLVNKLKGIVVAEISSASALDNETLEKLKQKLENILTKDKKILVESKIEPELIGGIKVKMDDLVFDGSIKGKLENLKRRLG